MSGRTKSEEAVTMTESVRGGVKTLAIRLPDELHAQLTLITQLEGVTLTDAIRAAIDGYVEQRRGNEALAAQANAALAQIDEQAAIRRQALQSLLGTAPKATAAAPTPIRRSTGDKATRLITTEPGS
jgi:predicted DNA-binding protein